MEILQKLVLYLHIASGFTALTVGIIPMIAKKGSRLHVSTGRIYAWAMYLVAASAIMTFLLKPYHPFLVYLAFIGVFSFYLTYTGVQLVRQKDKPQANVRDWFICVTALLSGAAMLALSGWHFLQSDVFFGILYVVFGTFLARISFQDIEKFRGKTHPQKMKWFFLHISRMVGAYIATFTAFCVVNASKVEFIHPLVVWLAPGIIGSIAIRRWIAYYRKKLRVT